MTTNKSGVKPGFVYLIQAEGSSPPRYKIGITTTTVENRLKQLNRQQSAYPLILVHSISADNPRAVEKYLHNKFKAQQAHNEWYTFTPFQLSVVMREMKNADTANGSYAIVKPSPKTRKSVYQQPAIRLPEISPESRKQRILDAQVHKELAKSIRLYPTKRNPKPVKKQKGNIGWGVPIFIGLLLIYCLLTAFPQTSYTQNNHSDYPVIDHPKKYNSQ